MGAQMPLIGLFVRAGYVVLSKQSSDVGSCDGNVGLSVRMGRIAHWEVLTYGGVEA